MTMELRSSLTGIPVLENGLSRQEMRHGEVPEVTATGLKQHPPATAGGSRPTEGPTEEDFWDEYYPIIESHDWSDVPIGRHASNMLWSESNPVRVFIEYLPCRRCGCFKRRIEGQYFSHAFCDRDKKIRDPMPCNEALMRLILEG